jgi:hypothetical protein
MACEVGESRLHTALRECKIQVLHASREGRGAFLAGLTRFAAHCTGIGGCQTPTKEAIIHLTERMEQHFAEATEDRHKMREDFGWLKRIAKDQFYRVRAAAIFGHLLTQGYDATYQVADLLQDARQTGVISDRDYQEALASDLLWGGQTRDSPQPIVLVLEASWMVGHIDVERAARRAAVLRQAGLRALPVAAGQESPPNTQDDARRSGVAIVHDGTVDQESWDAALAQA